MLRGRAARRLTIAVGGGAAIGAALIGISPLASANQDPAKNPPNCSAADLEGVRAGVSAATSAYLFTHPDVNNFYTSLEGLPRDQVGTQVADFLAKNPQYKADITGIRQPLQDIKNRCGNTPAPRP